MLVDATTSSETLVIALDDRQCGVSIGRITGTDDPDALLGVVDVFAEAARSSIEVTGLIVASLRPDGEFVVGDLERWHDADESCAESDIDLIEWFVIGATIFCPRELCGVPARWTD